MAWMCQSRAETTKQAVFRKEAQGLFTTTKHLLLNVKKLTSKKRYLAVNILKNK